MCSLSLDVSSMHCNLYVVEGGFMLVPDNDNMLLSDDGF